MKRIATLALVIVACAAPSASARPVIDAPSSTKVQRTDLSTIAAHRDAISQAQWEQAASRPELPLVDATDSGGQFPTLLVVLGLSVPLGFLLVQVAAKTTHAYRRSHRAA